MKIKLMKRIDHFKDTSSFLFEPQEGISWKAGQYLRIKLEHQDPDERGINRFFSISSAPYEKDLRITTKFDLENGSSFKKAFRDLKVGDALDADLPKGKMFVEGAEQSLCMIAGGIGITPFRAILLDLVHQQSPLPIALLYSSRGEEILFYDELQQACRQLKDGHMFFSPVRISKEMIREQVRFFSSCTVFLSGSAGLVKGLADQCMELGKEKERIKKDLFIGY